MSAESGDLEAAIACSLDAGSLEARVQEWRALVATSVEVVEAVEVEGGGGDGMARSVRLVLAPTDEALVRATSLGQSEKQCCPFFDVVVEIEAARRSLVLYVPDGAEESLATFVALRRA